MKKDAKTPFNADSEIYEITPFTTTDFKDKLSAVVWFCGCNMRCKYCYNAEVVLGRGMLYYGDLKRFLQSRVGKLEAVVLSGGECTIAKSFLDVARLIKDLGFLLKIDTNGSNPKALKLAISEGIVDYVALDFKSTNEKFYHITGSDFYLNFRKSLEILIKSGIKFEVRTTLHREFLDENDISKMSQTLQKAGYKNSYYLHYFLDTGLNLGDITNSKKGYELSKISSKLELEFRNFAV